MLSRSLLLPLIPILVVSLAAPARAHEPPSGLLAHFTFDGTLEDATGNGFTGEMIGDDDGAAPAPIMVDGKFGQALSFDGARAVRIPLDLNYEQYPEITITGWVYLDNSDARGTVIGSGSGSGPRITVIGDDIYATHTDGRNQANNVLRSGSWFFFAGTWDYRAGSMRLSYRARSQSEPFDTSALKPPAQDLWIGALNDGLQASAEALAIDDVRVYGRALSGDELTGLRLGPSEQKVAESGASGGGERAGLLDVEVPGTLADDGPRPTAPETTSLSDLGQRDPAEYSDEARGVDVDSMRHTVVFDGAGGSGETRYTLVASGEIDKAEGDVDGFQATINANDIIEGRTATGLVGSAVDAYYVYGGVEDISLENPAAAKVYVDGELVAGGMLTAYTTDVEPQLVAARLPDAKLRYGDNIYRFGGMSGSEGDYYTTMTFFEDQALLQDIQTKEENDKPCKVTLQGARLDAGSANAEIDNCEQGGAGVGSIFSDATSPGSVSGAPDNTRGIVSLQVCTSNPLPGAPLSLRFKNKRVKGIRVKKSRINDDGTLGMAEEQENLFEQTNCYAWRQESVCDSPSVATGVRLYFAEGTLAAPKDYLTGVELLCSQLQENQP